MSPPGASRHERVVAVHLLDICVMLSLGHQFLREIQLVWIYYTAKLYLFAKGSSPQTYPVVGTAYETTPQTTSHPHGTNRSPPVGTKKSQGRDEMIPPLEKKLSKEGNFLETLLEAFKRLAGNFKKVVKEQRT